MGGKSDDARKSFQDSLAQAQRIGMRAGAMEARGALRRLDRAAATKPPNPQSEPSSASK